MESGKVFFVAQVSSTSKNPSKGGYLAQHALLDQLPILEVWVSWGGGGEIRKNPWKLVFTLRDPGSPKLRMMVMEPKYLVEEVIIHPNRHLTR